VIKKGSIVRRVSGANLEERLAFYSMPEPNSGCLLWLGSVDRKGYGQLRFGGSLQPAHRLSLSVALGRPLPRGQLACHTCDVRSCINPDHLFLGTCKDNTADMMRKGRHDLGGLALGWGRVWPNRVRGERVHSAKLTEADVRAIRAAVGTHRNVASDFGISVGCAKAIRHRRAWKHVQ
jgi:hypothetical protein